MLVGHSTGGLISRVYAARYQDLAGMVLVDPTPPDYATLREAGRLQGLSTYWSVVRDSLPPAGLYRAAHTLGIVDGAQRFLPEHQVEAAVANMLTRRHRCADAQETLGLAGLAAQVRAANHHLGSLPLTVLVGGPANRESWHSRWLELQRELRCLATDSTYVYADHTGHHIHHDDPELVTRTIRALVDQVRDAMMSRTSGPGARRNPTDAARCAPMGHARLHENSRTERGRSRRD